MTDPNTLQTSADNTKTRAAKRYESAVDLWLIVLLLLAPVVATGLAVYLVIDGRPGEASPLFLAAAVAIIVPAAFIVPCRYTLLNDTLSVRSGLICYQIPLSEIVSVEKSRSLRSGPALSLRRVAVHTQRRTILISPKDRDGFIQDVTHAVERARHL